MQQAIKFFKSKGVEVSGGITYNFSGSKRQRWESFCYSNPEHLKMIKDIAELTARYFDEIVLDDYYFTNCKCDLCIKAKGDRSWGDFRMDLLDKVGREMIVEPAHRVNPKCKVIIKYPNWYDHFHGLGFDLKRGLEGGWSSVVWDSNGFSNQIESASITITSVALTFAMTVASS